MTQFKVGDRVKVSIMADLGTITGVWRSSTTDLIFYDYVLDNHPADRYLACTSGLLTLLDESKCECGATKCGHPSHSSFCPLFKN